ncbi:MAG TPA: SulP family inorganic anion transporter, partial [Burkholderiales bacterium]|nr:SulP family inorganic anion transporter [Burkholderiales bacterium]
MKAYSSLATRNWVLQLLPFLRWWPRVNRETVRSDLSAGLTGAVLVLPQGVAFATIAGMPPEYGLYAAMVPTLLAALYGSSWHLMGGPTTATSIVIFSVMSPIAHPGTPDYVQLVLTMSLLAGVFKLAMGIARMGMLVNFVSQTVVIGFTAGAGFLIAGGQIKHFFGLAMAPGISFMETLEQFFLNLHEIDWLVTSVALVTLATGIISRRRFPRFPYMIAAMVVGSVYAYLLTLIPGLDAAHHIRTVGALPSAIPPFSLPTLSFEAVRKTTSAALVVGIVGLTEAISIGRAIAVRSEQRIDANQEFIGQGIANIAGAFFSAYAASGSLNRSGANYEAGAKTPLASIFSALFLVLVLLLVAPLAAYLPIPAMAGVLLLVARGLIDIPNIRKVLNASGSESAVLIVTLLATLFVQLEFAIYTGVMLSLMLYLKRTSRPLILDVKPDPGEHSYHYSADTGLPDCPQIKMIRINGSIFFGAVDHVQRYLQDIDLANPRQKHVLIDATAMNFIDLAGAEMLAQEARRRRRLGGGLYFYGVKKEVLQLLARGGYLDEIGQENIFPIKFRA